MKQIALYTLSVAALTVFLAGGASALDVERFIDKLPPDQRDKILSQAKDAINKMSKASTDKKNARNKSDAKMTVDLIKELYKKAEEAYKNGDMAAAYTYYATIVNANVKGVDEIQQASKEKLTLIEAEALARYNEADIEFRKGEHVKSAELLQDVIDNYPYCSVADKATVYMRKVMADPKAAADIGFAKGMRYEKAEDFYNAVKTYKDVAEKYGPKDDTSPSQSFTGGIRAKIRVEQLLEDPYVKEAIARAEQFNAKAKAPALLTNGRNYIWNKRYDLARTELETLIRDYQGSPEADQAKILLETIP
jgi:tetratricopeptide (TPR) repeat protein